MQQFIVRVTAQLAGRYDLPMQEYRVKASSPAGAAGKAWRMFKRQPQLKRKRLDNIRFQCLRAGAVEA